METRIILEAILIASVLGIMVTAAFGYYVERSHKKIAERDKRYLLAQELKMDRYFKRSDKWLKDIHDENAIWMRRIDEKVSDS